MTDPSHGLVSAEEGERGRLEDSFDEDESPFLDNRRFIEDEQESFIDATADSYSAPPPPPPPLQQQQQRIINPFDDNNRIHSSYHKDKANYDSFDSQDDESDVESDSDYSASDYSSEGERDGTLDYPEDEDEEDTQHLLTSSNAKKGGMGMGMRAGETGTGTMLGLDLEQNENQQNDEYDTLPMSTVDVRRMKDRNNSKDETGKRGGSKKSKGRKRRSGSSKKRRESTGSDHVLGLGAIRTEQMAAIAKKRFRVHMAWNVFYVFAWYSCSTALSFYNKWLFSPNHHNFQYPLFTSSFHMVAQFMLSSITLLLIPSLRPKSAPTPKDFGTKIMPCAVASGLDIGLSNSSLKTITLAFYTMCKSSSLAFVLLFAFAFRLEKPTWMLAGVIAVICTGLFMMVMSEVDFVLIGFIQVMLASVLGGLRWALTQLLLEKSDAKAGSLVNPISTIFFLSPIMGICLGIVSGIFEGFGTIFNSPFFETTRDGFVTMGLVLLGGLIAFLMLLAEFNLIIRTSVVSLSVMGIVKEVVTIVISSIVFHDHLTLVNILGLFITLTGIGFYHFMKYRELKAKTRREAKDLADSIQAKVNKKKERKHSRKLKSEQDYGEGSSGGSGSGLSREYKDGDGDGDGDEEPWNHSLMTPSDKTITAKTHKTRLQNDDDVFILDDDEDIAPHGSR
ncbi:Triose-phosphate Transporter [Entomortierella beljakovae]|nr:Triose-phosphate Transporter [Entomortierella beljakovae]